MKILVVAFLPIPKNITGGTQVIDQQIKSLRYSGNLVEIISIFSGHKENKNITFFYEGFKYNIVYREDAYIYFDPYNPLREIEDEEYLNDLFEIIKQKREFNIIHFHLVYPLKIIEKVKKLGFKVVVTLHDFGYYLPFSPFLISHQKLLENPYNDITLTDFSNASLYNEALLIKDLKKKEIDLEQYTQRKKYVDNMFKNFVDMVIGNGSYPILHTIFFGTQYKKVGNLVHIVGNRKLNVKKYHKKDKIIIGFVNYAVDNKGIYFLLKIIEQLKDYRDRFELRFYGALLDKKFKNLLYQKINRDKFYERHIKIMNSGLGYKKNDIDRIANEIDVVLFTENNLNGVGGIVHQFSSRGCLVINPLSIINIVYVLYRQNKNLQEIKDFIDKNYNVNIFLNQNIIDEINKLSFDLSNEEFVDYCNYTYMPSNIDDAMRVINFLFYDNFKNVADFYKKREVGLDKKNIKDYLINNSLEENIANNYIRLYNSI